MIRNIFFNPWACWEPRSSKWAPLIWQVKHIRFRQQASVRPLQFKFGRIMMIATRLLLLRWKQFFSASVGNYVGTWHLKWWYPRKRRHADILQTAWLLAAAHSSKSMPRSPGLCLRAVLFGLLEKCNFLLKSISFWRFRRILGSLPKLRKAEKKADIVEEFGIPCSSLSTMPNSTESLMAALRTALVHSTGWLQRQSVMMSRKPVVPRQGTLVWKASAAEGY